MTVNDVYRDRTKSLWKTLEKDYWKYVDSNAGKDVIVEYAADLPADKVGSGFPHEHFDSSKLVAPSVSKSEFKKYMNHPWNLNNFTKGKESLM